MQLSDIIHSNAVIANLKATSKKKALQELADFAADAVKIDAKIIFETLMQRERLGSTGLGRGIAIPHGKFAAIDKVHGVFARLAQPIDFESTDDEPVDLIFLLMAPESAGADHLKALARISRMLRDKTLVEKLRGTEDAGGLYSILTEPSASEPHAA